MNDNILDSFMQRNDLTPSELYTELSCVLFVHPSSNRTKKQFASFQIPDKIINACSYAKNKLQTEKTLRGNLHVNFTSTWFVDIDVHIQHNRPYEYMKSRSATHNIIRGLCRTTSHFLSPFNSISAVTAGKSTLDPWIKVGLLSSSLPQDSPWSPQPPASLS